MADLTRDRTSRVKAAKDKLKAAKAALDAARKAARAAGAQARESGRGSPPPPLGSCGQAGRPECRAGVSAERSGEARVRAALDG
jgi:hypothetical protein